MLTKASGNLKKNPDITIFIDDKLCKGVDGCGLCIHICPKKVFEESESITERGIRLPNPVSIDKCTGCLLCMMYCPDFALVMQE